MTSEERKRPDRMSLPELDAAVERESEGSGEGGDGRPGGDFSF